MKRLLLTLGLAAALMGGCVQPSTAPSAPRGAGLAAAQEGWPAFEFVLDYASEAQRQRALLTQAEFDTLRQNEREWWEALVLFADVGTLRIYNDAGWWDEFIGIALWDADDRGDIMARRNLEAYDDLMRAVLDDPVIR